MSCTELLLYVPSQAISSVTMCCTATWQAARHHHCGVFAAEELNKKNGWDMRLHVDAATGGFITPFIHPELKFDFRLKNVNSISTSGHK